jgi:hypothetical protein
VEAGLEIRQQVPDDDQDGAPDDDDGSLFAAAPRDAPVAFGATAPGCTATGPHYNGAPHVTGRDNWGWITYVRNEQPDEPGEHRSVS